MPAPNKAAHLRHVQQELGYVSDLRKIMVTADYNWVEAYEPFVRRTYTGQRLLDSKTKELLQIVVEAALRADADQIQSHIRTALKEGATSQEILEALETVALPMGMLAFRRGIQAWANEVGLEPIEPSSG